MRLSILCFVLAGLAGTTGVLLGIVMGIQHDFTLAPAHAHLNLLGWVSMAIYGLYHRAADSRSRLAWVQVGCAATGFPLFSGGLAVSLATGSETVLPLVVIGALCWLVGMVLFVALVIRDAMVAKRAAQVAP